MDNHPGDVTGKVKNRMWHSGVRTRNKKNKALVSLIALLLLFSISCGAESENYQAGTQNPFHAYLEEPHPSYSYEEADIIEGEGFTTYILRMVSQEWLTDDLVNEPVWWHWVTIVVPDQLDHTTGLLWIGGGSTSAEQPEAVSEWLISSALETKSVAINLHNIPFQPISFRGDTLDHRYEDALIAYGWREFLENGARDEDAQWLARLPMTAAVMRAMDTVTHFSETALERRIDRFVVSGASKRGWTAWTTAIFDDRVIAVVPVVIDLLNMLPSFEHHWQAYGEWSPAIRDYENERIMDWQYSAEYSRLRELVDPFSYLDQVDIPKFIINAGSDEFFLPDSWQFYWEDLPGQKYLRYIPNTGHSMSDTDAIESLISFYHTIINSNDFPGFSWSIENDIIHLETDPANPPAELKLWRADNAENRDFRLYVIDRSWESRPIPLSEDGIYEIILDEPENGYSAFFAEATFPGSPGNNLKLTSGVVVLPDSYPFEPFETDHPMGTISDR